MALYPLLRLKTLSLRYDLKAGHNTLKLSVILSQAEDLVTKIRFESRSQHVKAERDAFSG